MSLPRYSEYKASGVEWLGDVPGHWEQIRYKNIFGEKNSIIGASLPSGSISFGRVVFKDDEFLLETTKASYQEVLSGEFLINPINLNYDLKSLRTALSEIDTCVSPAYIVLRSKVVSDKSYLKYQLHMFDLFHMKTLGAGVRQTITFNDIGGCFTVRPPLREQNQIATFLDRETGKIDALIAEQRQLVELLAEKRQAVISHAVTKGLNPNVPMKDSGIEWLGEVPEHWDVKRLKHSLRLLTEKTDRRDNPIALENIEGWSGRFIPTGTEFQGEGIAFESGDILFGKLRPYLAKVYLTESPGEAVGDFHVLRPAQKMNGRFVVYQMLNRDFITLVDSSTFGAKMPRVAWEFMSNMMLTVPPREEQQAVAAFLDTETAKFDTLTAEATRVIELLQERRSALISAAVTGKVDVRKFA